MAGHPTPEAVSEDITSVVQLECVWTSKRTSVLLNLCVCVCVCFVCKGKTVQEGVKQNELE